MHVNKHSIKLPQKDFKGLPCYLSPLGFRLTLKFNSLSRGHCRSVEGGSQKPIFFLTYELIIELFEN